ncbi:helix-turn-helix domain-containing protein [Pseudomonas mucidolens]|nr:helix-turn-helix transcriptional regulator [Pseudomonas mucidolens]
MMNSSFGGRLKEIRRTFRLSQHEFGALGGVATNAQGKYENDSRQPRSGYLVAIWRRGVDVLYVLTGERTASSAYPLVESEIALVENYRRLNPTDQRTVSMILSTLLIDSQ